MPRASLVALSLVGGFLLGDVSASAQSSAAPHDHAAHPAELPAASDPPARLTLSAVLSDARAHREEIRAARSRAQATRLGARAAAGLADPMVTTRLDHLPLMLDGADVSVMIEQPVALSGVLGATERREAAAARALDAEADARSLDVEAEARAAFIMLAEEQEMRAVVAEQEKLAASIARVVEARLAVSGATPADAVRAALEQARLAGDLEARDADLRAADAMLDSARGRTPDGVIPLCDLSSALDRKADLTPEIATERPELVGMQAKIEAAREDEQVMRNMRAPMAMFGVGAAFTMSDGFGFMTEIGLSVPLDWAKYDAGVAQARAMVAMESAERDAMRTMFAGELAVARARVDAARTRERVLRETLIAQAEQAFELTLTAYGAGQTPVVAVLEAAATLADTRMALVTARADLARALAREARAGGSSRAPKEPR